MDFDISQIISKVSLRFTAQILTTGVIYIVIMLTLFFIWFQARPVISEQSNITVGGGLFKWGFVN